MLDQGNATEHRDGSTMPKVTEATANFETVHRLLDHSRAPRAHSPKAPTHGGTENKLLHNHVIGSITANELRCDDRELRRCRYLQWLAQHRRHSCPKAKLLTQTSASPSISQPDRHRLSHLTIASPLPSHLWPTKSDHAMTSTTRRTASTDRSSPNYTWSGSRLIPR